MNGIFVVCREDKNAHCMKIYNNKLRIYRHFLPISMIVFCTKDNSVSGLLTVVIKSLNGIESLIVISHIFHDLNKVNIKYTVCILYNIVACHASCAIFFAQMFFPEWTRIVLIKFGVKISGSLEMAHIKFYYFTII